jgi:acyl-CoA synthetase (AMP-forming)/AMP-acid ligase II
VTSTFGSPAIWARVTEYCLAQGVTLPTLRRVLMAGAPVPTYLHERFRQILSPDADTHTPYGATEALPIASASGRAILAAHAEHSDPTAGTCVGKPAPGVELRIIGITDAPIAQWDERLVLPLGQIGEICVKGAAVTKTYINRPASTAAAKIADGAAIWHRMGDLGYLDAEGRIWFYGRKTHRVETANGPLYTEPVERVFNQHPAVARSALVGVRAGGRRQEAGVLNGLQLAAGAPTQSSALQGADPSPQRPIVIVEPKDPALLKDATRRAALIAELRELGARYPMTAGIVDFMLHPSFPVDIRHNAKIFREQLAVWAESV